MSPILIHSRAAVYKTHTDHIDLFEMDEQWIDTAIARRDDSRGSVIEGALRHSN